MKRYGGGEKSGTIKKLEGHGVLGIVAYNRAEG